MIEEIKGTVLIGSISDMRKLPPNIMMRSYHINLTKEIKMLILLEEHESHYTKFKERQNDSIAIENENN